MTADGRTTVPKEVRKRLKLETGDRLTWYIDGSTVVLRAKNRSIMEFAGMLHRPVQRQFSVEEIDEAIAKMATDSGMAGFNPSGR
jgi:antitoxin PrlF